MINPERIAQKESLLRRAEIADIPAITDLLTKNLAKNLTEDEKREGFLMFEPTQLELEKIIQDTGVYISMKGDELKGYLITMSKELAETIPFEAEFMENAEGMIFEGKPLGDYNYALLAQICVAKQHRFGMTFSKLHFYAHSMLKEQGFEIGIGEIADENKRSLDSHSGDFFDAGTYTSSSGVKWHIMVKDYTKE